MKKVVVIGAGFAGLMALKQLYKEKGFNLTLINKDDHFLFTPRLTELLNNSVSQKLVVRDIKRIFDDKVDFVKGTAELIDLNENSVIVSGKKYPYDFLIIANGATTNFFGNEKIRENTLEYKDYNSVVKIKEKVAENIRRYSETGQKEFLTFAVIGAGLTGIELMCSLREYVITQLEKSDIDTKEARFVMVQGADTIAPYLEESTRKIIESYLKSNNMEVLTGTKVENIEDNAIISENFSLKAATMVWTAGIKPNTIKTEPGLANEKGKIRVIPTLEAESRGNIFVAGDIAFFMHEGIPLAPTAQIAFQEGIALGKNILRKTEGKKARPFRYKHLGTLIVLGRGFGIVNYGKMNLKGKLAYLLRDMIYRYRMFQLA